MVFGAGIAGAMSLALTVAPLVIVGMLWMRVQRLEARLAALEQENGRPAVRDAGHGSEGTPSVATRP
jgi:hypothetical protein